MLARSGLCFTVIPNNFSVVFTEIAKEWVRGGALPSIQVVLHPLYTFLYNIALMNCLFTCLIL